MRYDIEEFVKGGILCAIYKSDIIKQRQKLGFHDKYLGRNFAGILIFVAD